MKVFKRIIFYGLYVYSPGGLFSQSPANDKNWYPKDSVRKDKLKSSFLNTTLVLFILIVVPLSLFSQILPFDPSNWIVTFSDDFTGSRNANWVPLEPIQPWGNQIFSSETKYLTYGSDGSRVYLDLRAYVENVNGTLTNTSAGIYFPCKKTLPCTNPDNPFYYGYYEIEAKLTKGGQSLENNGLWPAFWFQHSESPDLCISPGHYWYEEVDIFEPGSDYVYHDVNYFHYGTLLNDDNPDVQWRGPGWEGIKENCDMFNWHRWGVEWLPDRLTFYYDGIPVHTCSERVPFHEKPQLFIDLQTDPDPRHLNPRTVQGTFVGSFRVNYFRYYELIECSGEITETLGDGYNFTGWSNDLSNVKRYCIFKNTSTASNSNVIIHSSNVELKSNFTVPVGAVFEIQVTPCQ